MPSETMIWVLCVQVDGDSHSERFIVLSADLNRPDGYFVRTPLPLVEADVRDELAKAGVAPAQIDTYLAKARRFTTTTTTNDWWPARFGARRL